MDDRLSPNQWREDLRYLVDALAREHRCLHHTVSRWALDGARRALHARIPSLAAHQVVVELARLVAMVGDGHTALRLGEVARFRRYPLVLDRFSDGLFVRAIAPDHAEAAGA